MLTRGSVCKVPGSDLFHRHIPARKQPEGRNTLPQQHSFAAESNAAGFLRQPEHSGLQRVVNCVRNNQAGAENGKVFHCHQVFVRLHAQICCVCQNIAVCDLFGEQSLIREVTDFDRAAGANFPDLFSSLKSPVPGPGFTVKDGNSPRAVQGALDSDRRSRAARAADDHFFARDLCR